MPWPRGAGARQGSCTWGTIWCRIVFPYWVVSALQWLCDTRDPFGSGHGYLRAQSAVDEAVLPDFERTELQQNRYLDRRHGLDRGQFEPVLD
jgi:hypothetical protein